jgi:hypothetical protein
MVCVVLVWESSMCGCRKRFLSIQFNTYAYVYIYILQMYIIFTGQNRSICIYLQIYIYVSFFFTAHTSNQIEIRFLVQIVGRMVPGTDLLLTYGWGESQHQTRIRTHDSQIDGLAGSRTGILQLYCNVLLIRAPPTVSLFFP